MSEDQISEWSITKALAGRYSAVDGWAFMSQIRSATGQQAKQNRYADAMAFDLYPSRGLEIHGFEIKISRADFMREVKTPEKSQLISQYCDRWWIAAPVGLIDPGELPVSWGLIELIGRSIVRVKLAAPKLTPKDPPRAFWCAVMRAFTRSPQGSLL